MIDTWADCRVMLDMAQYSNDKEVQFLLGNWSYFTFSSLSMLNKQGGQRIPLAYS